MLLLLLCGCGGAGEGAKAPAAAARRAPPEEVAAVKAMHPTLARIQGNLWIVGLPPKHGWERERRVLLTQHDPDRDVDLKVGVVVVLDDTYATAAPVGIVYEEPGLSFNGASAQVLPADQRLRLGRGFGSISAVMTTTQIEITLGRNDGVGLGDVYEVRSLDGKRVVGRVKVSALEDSRAKATMLNAAPMSLGQEVVYQPKSAEEQATRAGLRIVVCDFEPKAHTEQMAAVGQAFAHDLAVHLREAAGSWQGLEVMQVPQMVSDHDPARALGRSYGADIVVWGAAMCIEKQGCAQPVFTVVDPARMAHAEMKGHEVRFDALNPGGSMERGSAKDPAGLVFGLLGSLAYEAERFGDAVYYLGRVPDGALEAADHYRALRDLGQSLYFLGRIETALETAGRLEREARGKDRGWEAAGSIYRARILVDRGELDQALTLFKQARAVYGALGDRDLRAVTLGDIANVLANKGEVDEALKLHREALAVHDALGDRRERAVTLCNIARVLADKGEVDEALKLHREALAVVEALGDRRSRAVILGDIASLLANKGDVDEALKLHRESLAVFEALGDRRSRAVTLGGIAR
ncbi:MAG: tetratricopeptide repeat protein, partial [Byssovorax sp.]